MVRGRSYACWDHFGCWLCGFGFLERCCVDDGSVCGEEEGADYLEKSLCELEIGDWRLEIGDWIAIE